MYVALNMGVNCDVLLLANLTLRVCINVSGVGVRIGLGLVIRDQI